MSIKVGGWIGGWTGFAITEDGQYRFEQSGEDWKVWKWDGKRYRRQTTWPDYLVEFAEKYEVTVSGA